MMRGWRLAAACVLLALAGPVAGAEVEIVSATPTEVQVRLGEVTPGALYRISYEDGTRRFVWENIAPTDGGEVILRDDKHLRPEYRLGCESSTGLGDPVVFDDKLKGAVVTRGRLTFGVPVSSFGGPGYLVPGLSALRRDDFGNSWIYMDRAPYAVLKYSPEMEYKFALLLPEALLDFEVDGEGNLYLLHPGNWLSKHGPLGELKQAWELPWGRGPGEFVFASGIALERASGYIYLADMVLGRVQRFNLEMELRPMPITPWGWIGRQDMPYTRPGQYREEVTYYLLDRPRQIVLDGADRLLVSCEHYISAIDLSTGKQLTFGRNPVLGWGGTFTDSPFSQSAGYNRHWQRHWLAGVDAAGNIYVADRENEFVVDTRIQVFTRAGEFLKSLSLEEAIVDAEGRRVYLTAVKSLACDEEGIFLVEAAGRIYRSPSREGIISGGELFLGPGAAGRQFDLRRAEVGKFRVERQAERVIHSSEGQVLGYPAGQNSTSNCEREGSLTIPEGARSMWMPARIGEPFQVTLLDRNGAVIPQGNYEIEYEREAGLFGTRYDFFRVTNRSGQTWREVKFRARAME